MLVGKPGVIPGEKVNNVTLFSIVRVQCVHRNCQERGGIAR